MNCGFCALNILVGGKVSIVIVEGKFDCQIAVIFTHTRLMIASSFEEQKNDAALP